MFKDSLRQLRKKHGISQYKLADDLNVAQSTIGNWESGTREPDFSTIKKIADYFHVSIDKLLGETDDPVPPSTKKEHPPEDVQEFYNFLIDIGVRDPNKALSGKAKTRLFNLVKNNKNLIVEEEDKFE